MTGSMFKAIFVYSYSQANFLIREYSVDFCRLSEDFSGAASVPFSSEITQALMSPINENDIEIKPDGMQQLLL